MYHPRNPHIFDPYDMDKLTEARRLLFEVFQYNYDHPPMRRMNGRLCTIIDKLDTLLNLNSAHQTPGNLKGE